MRLENVLALTHGSLMSQPDISLFNDIVIEASRVKRGSLFIALNPHEIREAINNGAYGIVYDKDVSFDDEEIAWIHVEDIYDALKKLTRFLLIDKELTAITCKPISLHVAKIIDTSKQLIILEGTLSENFSKLLKAPQGSIVFFTSTQIQDDLFTNTSELPQSNTQSIQIIKKTLFECAFIYKGIFYERQTLSPFFLPYLEEILELLTLKKIPFSFKASFLIPHFQALFVNANLHVKEFGTSNKVLIFEEDIELILDELYFILEETPWAKTLCIMPRTSHLTHPNILLYDSKEHAVEILQAKNFHFGLIYGLESSFFEEPSHQKQASLF